MHSTVRTPESAKEREFIEWNSDSERSSRSSRPERASDIDNYLRAALGLRGAGLFGEAAQLLNKAIELAPDQDALRVEYAALTEAQRDTASASRRWAEEHPKARQLAIYSRAVAALRRLGRLGDAEALLVRTVEDFPDRPNLVVQHAKIAAEQREWSEALRRWETVRARFPDHPSGFAGAARALRELGRIDEAKTVLSSAVVQFPEHSRIQTGHAKIVSIRHNDAAETSRVQSMPTAAADSTIADTPAACIEDARALQEQGRAAECAALLAKAIARFPQDPALSVEYANCAQAAGDWAEAVRRWETARALASDQSSIAYTAAAVALRRIRRFTDAEQLLRDATERFPAEWKPAVHFASIAQRGHRWPDAIARWELVRQRFPDRPEGYANAAVALAKERRFEESDALLQEAMRRFPEGPLPLTAAATIAGLRQDWRTAAGIWEEAQRRFPKRRDFATRLFEARLHLAESDPDATGVPEPPGTEPSSGDRRMYDIMMSFEGLGHGCEFGAVQRKFGAEPLGLLRWAAVLPQKLCAALDCEFAGVGAPEDTDLRVRSTNRGNEYWLTDKRFGISMHTFVGEDEIGFDDMFQKSCRRLQFLSRKLVDDLRAAEKICVYKFSLRDVTDGEARAIHTALCRYNSDNKLLCVRKSANGHRPGDVEMLTPGLMIGYIDQFTEVQADGRLGSASDVWTKLCCEAYERWKGAAAYLEP